MADDAIPETIGAGTTATADPIEDLMGDIPPPFDPSATPGESLEAPSEPDAVDPVAEETPPGDGTAPPDPGVESEAVDPEVAAIEALAATNPELAKVLTDALEAKIAEAEKPAEVAPEVTPQRSAALQVADLAMTIQNYDGHVQAMASDLRSRQADYNRAHATYQSALQSGEYAENDPLLAQTYSSLMIKFNEVQQIQQEFIAQRGGVQLLKEVENEIRAYPPFAAHAKLYAQMRAAGEILSTDTFDIREAKLNAKLAPTGKAVGEKPKGIDSKALVEKLKKISGPKIAGARTGKPVAALKPNRQPDELDVLSDKIFGKKA